MIHCSQCLNHRLKQDHRGITGRYHPLRGFGSVTAPMGRCSAARPTMRGATAIYGTTGLWCEDCGVLEHEDLALTKDLSERIVHWVAA